MKSKQLELGLILESIDGKTMSVTAFAIDLSLTRLKMAFLNVIRERNF